MIPAETGCSLSMSSIVTHSHCPKSVFKFSDKEHVKLSIHLDIGLPGLRRLVVVRELLDVELKTVHFTVRTSNRSDLLASTQYTSLPPPQSSEVRRDISAPTLLIAAGQSSLRGERPRSTGVQSPSLQQASGLLHHTDKRETVMSA